MNTTHIILILILDSLAGLGMWINWRLTEIEYRIGIK